MLIVGDVPYNTYIDSKAAIEAVEIIVNPEKLVTLLKKIKVKKDCYISLGPYSKLYYSEKVKIPGFLANLDAVSGADTGIQAMKFNYCSYYHKNPKEFKYTE